jgi:outer membrane usher protein
LTRQINDSFVAVQHAAPLEGVRVYSNNQEVGRTDRKGRLLVPDVGSFYETQITIDERDVPLDHTIGDLRRVVAPAYRSGSLLGFDVRKLRAVEGVLSVASEKGPRPAENAYVTLRRDGRVQEFSTGRDGRYYIEDLAPGRYEARLQSGARECRFTLSVPVSKDAILSLPEVIACE